MTMLCDGMLLGAEKPYVSPTFVSASQRQLSAVTSIDILAPSGMLENDTMLSILFDNQPSRTWSYPPGWSPVASVGSSLTSSVAIFQKTVSASEPSAYTFGTGVSGNELGFILAYRGATSVSAENLTAAAFGSADPQVAASMAVVKNRILVAACLVANSTVTLTSGPSGMTSRGSVFSGGPQRGAVFDLVNPSTGASGTKSFDISTAVFGAAFLVEIQ